MNDYEKWMTIFNELGGGGKIYEQRPKPLSKMILNTPEGQIYEQRSGSQPQKIINESGGKIYELLIMEDTFRRNINLDLSERQGVGLGTSILKGRSFDYEPWGLAERRARIGSMQLPKDPRDAPEAKGLMLAELEADEKRREALEAMIEKPLTYIGIRPLTFEKVIKERLGLYDIFNQ
jgi:hypothetical protein